MILLNQNDTCQGKYTFGYKGGKSKAIDMILVNSNIYNISGKMNIDKDSKQIMFSDQNLIIMELDIIRKEHTAKDI